jgi:hypothetical protein
MGKANIFISSGPGELSFMYSLALIIFVVSEKAAFEHFPIGSNVNLCPAVAQTAQE